jgi:hypothetical protein
VLPPLFLAASFLTTFSARIVIALGIEIAAVLGSLALQSYATVLSRRERYGEISSVLEGASTIGDLTMFALAAAVLVFVAVYFFRYPVER